MIKHCTLYTIRKGTVQEQKVSRVHSSHIRKETDAIGNVQLAAVWDVKEYMKTDWKYCKVSSYHIGKRGSIEIVGYTVIV